MYALILVDYNALEKAVAYTKLCRQYLGEAGASHVVIVENGTVEKPLEMLAQAFGEPKTHPCDQVEQTVYCFEKDGQQIAYCHSGGNLGYARGNNLGVRIADAIWSDSFYIISNNDLVFEKPLDMTLVDSLFDRHPDIGIIGPTVITPAGERQSPRYWQSASHRLIANYWIPAFGGLLGEERRMRLWERCCRDTIDGAESGYHAWVSGCFFFVRAETFHRAGMFDEHTFLYAEEMILAKRLEAVGSRVYFCREIEVIHKHAESTKKVLAAFRMTQIDFEANYYCYKNYLHTSPILLALAKVSFWLFTALFKLKQKLKEGNS